MKAQFINSQEADNKVAAFFKSQLISTVNSSAYSTKQKAKAEGMLYALQLAYASTRSFLNYRKSFVAIKFENAKVKNRQILKELESDFETQGITKVVSGQGIIYRLPKQV